MLGTACCFNQFLVKKRTKREISGRFQEKSLIISVFFFPVNLKSARERQFFLNVHGYFFAFTGTFFGKFTGKLMRSRAVFGIYSRAVFMVHGHDFLKMFTGTR